MRLIVPAQVLEEVGHPSHTYPGLSNVYRKIQIEPNRSKLFPICQVRVVRFYQSCSRLASPPPRCRHRPPPPPRPPRLPRPLPSPLPSSSPSSSPTSELSVHRWTSTWDMPSSVCTAGPQQPDRMPEEMPDRMSDRMPEDMPDRMLEEMPDRMPEDMPDKVPEFFAR